MKAAEMLAEGGDRSRGRQRALHQAARRRADRDDTAQPGSKVITVEEGSLAGGFGAAVMERVRAARHRRTSHFHRIGIPDEYVHHGAQDVLRAQYDLHAEGIAKRVREFVDGKS